MDKFKDRDSVGPEVTNSAAVATTLTLLTVGLRNAVAERHAIKDEEDVEIAIGEEGVVRARRGDPLVL